jgi:hypothetical protein
MTEKTDGWLWTRAQVGKQAIRWLWGGLLMANNDSPFESPHQKDKGEEK